MLYVGPPDREARAKIFKLRLDKCICKSKMSPEQLADKVFDFVIELGFVPFPVSYFATDKWILRSRVHSLSA